MKLAHQLREALVEAPRSVLRIRGRALRRLSLYVLLSSALLALVAWGVHTYQGRIRQLLVGYLFPQDWRAAADLLLERILAGQTRDVLLNATLGGALLLVSTALFWLKEGVSAAHEERVGLSRGPRDELPLLAQAAEELKLLLLYLTVQMSLFWVGYPPAAWAKMLATGLSYAFLFFTFTVDFAAPTPQRHGARYGSILKVLARNPLLLFGFGALFALPPLLAGAAARALELEGGRRLALLFAAEVLSIACGCVAGTRVGARLHPEIEATRPPRPWTRILGWPLLLSAFALNIWVFALLGMSVHHKSQILKCRYRVDPSSIRLEAPSALGLIGGRLRTSLRFDLSIENPTSTAVRIEPNRLVILHRGEPVAETRLSATEVPAGETVLRSLSLDLDLRPGAALKGLDLLRGEAWSAVLYLRLARGLDLPIYLFGGG